MKTVRVLSACLEGAGAFLVTIQARFEPCRQPTARGGATEIHLTGLPDAVLRECRGRLACALAAGRLQAGPGRLFLHLAPAARRKSGEGLDLALLLASAAAAGHLDPSRLEGTLFLGEVGIDGALSPTPGGLAAALEARKHGVLEVVAPPATAREIAALEDVSAFAASHVAEALGVVTRSVDDPERAAVERPDPGEPGGPSGPGGHDSEEHRGRRLDEVRGQAEAKFALQVAAAGGHGLLLVGPPGSGKTMLARRLIDLMPPPTLEERIESTAIRSVAGRVPDSLAAGRPFRAPHHTTSFAGLLGGGSPITPGEISLAHRGVLFLDELPEFGREALEGLRQPLEEGRIHIARAGRRLELPAAFQLAAAMNPCPCGYAGHPRVVCRCPPSAVRRYRRRISGPVLDRVDVRVSVRPTPVESLVPLEGPAVPDSAGPDAAGSASAGSASAGPASAQAPTGAARVREVAAARARAAARSGTPNALLGPEDLDAVAPLDPDAARLLRRAAEERQLSSRAVQSLRRVARTVADLRGVERVDLGAVGAALSLRAGLGG